MRSLSTALRLSPISARPTRSKRGQTDRPQTFHAVHRKAERGGTVGSVPILGPTNRPITTPLSEGTQEQLDRMARSPEKPSPRTIRGGEGPQCVAPNGSSIIRLQCWEPRCARLEPPRLSAKRKSSRVRRPTGPPRKNQPDLAVKAPSSGRDDPANAERRSAAQVSAAGKRDAATWF